MKQSPAGGHGSLMSRKYFSMLFGGTLTMMVVAVLLMSDSVIAGAVIGADAVAGITLVTPLYAISAFFGSAVSLGVPILYSMEMGRFNRRSADRVFGFGLAMSLITGAALSALTSLFGDLYLSSCHPLPAVLEQARGYLFWMRFTMLCMPLDLLMSGAVYADGDEKISTAANLIQGAGNVAGSVILSHWLGIRGISLASFLFTAVSLGTLSLHLLKKTNSLHLNLFFSPALLWKTLRYSVIDASSYLFLGVFTALMNRFVTAEFGAEHLILISVAALCRELQLIFDGIGEAITPILSVYLGEDCFPGVRSIYRLAERTAVAEGLEVTAVLFLCAPFVPGVLGISDPEISRAAVTGLRILSFGSPFVSLLYLSTSYDLLIDRISLGLVVCGLRDLLIAAPLAALLGIWFGLNGFFAGLTLGPALAWVGSMRFLRVRYGSDAPLLLRQRERDKEALLYELTVEPNAVVRVRDELGEALKVRGYDAKTVNRVMLLFEELFMLLWEKNEGTTIRGECALVLTGDGVRMITRDTGVIFDLSDADLEVSSLRSYVLSSVAERVTARKRHLVTMSFNRNVFEVRGKKMDS